MPVEFETRMDDLAYPKTQELTHYGGRLQLADSDGVMHDLTYQLKSIKIMNLSPQRGRSQNDIRHGHLAGYNEEWEFLRSKRLAPWSHEMWSVIVFAFLTEHALGVLSWQRAQGCSDEQGVLEWLLSKAQSINTELFAQDSISDDYLHHMAGITDDNSKHVYCRYTDGKIECLVDDELLKAATASESHARSPSM